MSEASRAGGPLTSGGHPDLLATAPPHLCSRARHGRCRAPRRARRRTRLVRPASSRSSTRAGRSAIELVGRARHRQDAPARRARRAGRRARASRAVGLGVGARARPAVLGVRRRARRVRAGARAAAARRPRRRRPGGAGDGASRRCRRSPAGREVAPSTSATAAIAPCASCWSCWRAASRSCCARRPPLGDPASIELLGALLHRPPAAPVLLALAVRPRQIAERLAAALERAHRAETLVRLELVALTRGEAGELLGERDRGRRRGRPLRGERRQPVLPRAARAHAAGRARARRRRAATSLGGVEVPPTVVGGAGRGARPALRRARAACSRARRWPATRSIPSSPAAAAGVAEAAAIDALDELLRAGPRSARPTSRGASASGIRSCAGRSTRRRPAAGGSALTSARRGARGARRARVGARAPRRARGARGRPRRRSRSCARRARRPRSARPRAPPAGSPRALRLLPQDAPARGAGRAAARALGSARRHRPVRRQPRHAAREPRASCPQEAEALRVRLVVGVCRRRAPPRPPQAGARPPRERARRARRSRLAGGGRAHDRARGRQPVPGRVRRDARLGGARGRGGGAAGRPRRSWPRRSECAPSRARSAASSPQAQAHRDEAAALIDALGDDELARRLDALVHLATAEMYLDRFEASGRHAERALAHRPRHRAGRSLPAHLPDAGNGALDAGPHGGVRGGVRRRHRGARLVDNVQGARLEPLQPHAAPRSRPATSRSRSPPRRRASRSRGARREHPLRRTRPGRSPPRCSRPAAPSRRRTCSWRPPAARSCG